MSHAAAMTTSALMIVPGVIEITRGCSSIQPSYHRRKCLGNNRRERVDMLSHLLTTVTIAHCDCVIFKRIEVDRDTHRRPDFILPSVSLSDVAVIVPHDTRFLFLEHFVNATRFFNELRLVFEKRKYGGLYRGDPFVEFEIRTSLSAEIIFRVGTREKREDGTINTEGRLDDMWEKTFSRFIIEIRKIDTRCLLMRSEIEIGAVRKAIEFFAAKRKIEFKINRALRIVRAIVRSDFEFVYCIARDSHGLIKRMYLLSPLFKAFLPLSGVNKVFDFHLFEFT